MTRYYLDWAHGWLCVVSESRDNHEPYLERDYWPVEECTQYQAKHLIGSPCKRGSSSYVFTARVKGQTIDIGCGPYQQPDYDQQIVLKDQGQTRAIHTDREFIPCPKVKAGTQTRWYYGSWQKYTKTRGWVSA